LFITDHALSDLSPFILHYIYGPDSISYSQTNLTENRLPLNIESIMSLPASNGKTVLVTGINGYIASVLGQLLLKKGYSLRGTTRRVASAQPLLDGPYAAYKERVEIYEVPNMTVDGAFDEAVKGVDGIFHTASPIDFTLNTYELMVEPAVKGAETVLMSAIKAGPQLTSVVVTSSVIACVDPSSDPEHAYTEADFASVSLEKAIKDRDEGKQTPGGILYGASKTASERAVWKFRDEYKPSFAVTTVNPTVVIGPPIVLPSSGSKLNETLRPLFEIFSGEARTIGPNIGTGSFVDVRDVAYVHVWAYENADKADGERYIVAQGFGPLQAAADILREAYQGTEIGAKIPLGNPGQGYVGYNKEKGKVGSVNYEPGKFRVSGKKAEKETGVKYIPFKQSVLDTAKVFEALL